MFLSTLGLKSDGMITEMVRAQRQSYDGAIAPVEDHRGSHLPSNKCDVEVICRHINSYNPTISHYKRKNAPYKRYLNPELSIKEMYKDECEICRSYKDHIKDSDHDSEQYTGCIAYAKHKVKYTQARIEYQKPIPEEVVCFTADMQ